MKLRLRKEHLQNPIQWSLNEACKDKDLEVVGMEEEADVTFFNRPTDTKAWWMCDLRNPKELPDAEVDYIFLCNTEFTEDYKRKYKAEVFYLPQCGDDRPTPETGRDIKGKEVVFIGNFNSKYHNNRGDILTAIGKVSNLMLVSGEGYSKDTKYLYKNVPISLAISPQAKGYTSNRLYNILSSGGFCLTLWFEGIEDLFENKKHLVWFKTVEEAEQLTKYYLKHKEERNRIAREGNKLYKEKHTAKHRLEMILSIVDKTPLSN